MHEEGAAAAAQRRALRCARRPQASDDIVYPIPFNQLYHSLDSHYVDFGKDHDLPSFVLTGSIPSFSIQASDVLLMIEQDKHLFHLFAFCIQLF